MFCGGPAKDCKSLGFIGRLHDCLWPQLDRRSTDIFFGDAEAARDTMFFSRKRLRALFAAHNAENIKILLACTCGDCRSYRSRDEASAEFDHLDYVKRLSGTAGDDWILIPALVYLGKIQFIHAWARCQPLDPRNPRPRVEKPFETEEQNNLFWLAYKRTMEMLSPAMIEPGINNRPENLFFSDSQRFPYLDQRATLPSGSSASSIIPFKVPEEYVHKDFQGMLDQNYASCAKTDEHGDKVREYCGRLDEA